MGVIEENEFLEQGKAYGVNETHDSVWFELHPGDLTLKHIDVVFDIYDQLYEEDAFDFFSYENHMGNGELTFFKDHPEYLAYFIFTQQAGHIVLRKIKEWKHKKDQILERFQTPL